MRAEIARRREEDFIDSALGSALWILAEESESWTH